MIYKNIHTCNNRIKIDKNYLQNTSTKFFISHEILDNGMKFIKNIASNKQTRPYDIIPVVILQL